MWLLPPTSWIDSNSREFERGPVYFSYFSITGVSSAHFCCILDTVIILQSSGQHMSHWKSTLGCKESMSWKYFSSSPLFLQVFEWQVDPFMQFSTSWYISVWEYTFFVLREKCIFLLMLSWLQHLCSVIPVYFFENRVNSSDGITSFS